MIVHRFAVGVKKGARLDSVGKFTIVKLHGEEVAQFENGALARFVATDEAEPLPMDSGLPLPPEKPKVVPIELEKYPQKYSLKFSPAIEEKFVGNRLRFCSQGDTWDIFPSLALVLDGEGWCLELSWLNWSAVFEHTSPVKGQSLGNAQRQTRT